MERTKVCTVCGADKPIHEYHNRCNLSIKKTKIYYKSACKRCTIKYVTKMNKKNAEKIRVYQKNYQKRRRALRIENKRGF